MGNGIDTHLSKKSPVAQWAPHFAVEDRLEINNLLGIVIETNEEHIVI